MYIVFHLRIHIKIVDLRLLQKKVYTKHKFYYPFDKFHLQNKLRLLFYAKNPWELVIKWNTQLLFAVVIDHFLQPKQFLYYSHIKLEDWQIYPAKK